jgi:hypothetical protein
MEESRSSAKVERKHRILKSKHPLKIAQCTWGADGNSTRMSLGQSRFHAGDSGSPGPSNRIRRHHGRRWAIVDVYVNKARFAELLRSAGAVTMAIKNNTKTERRERGQDVHQDVG